MKIFNKKEKANETLKLINKKFFLKRTVYLILGITLSALAFNLFFLPNQIVYGGVSGLSIITKEYFGISPAVFIFISSLFLLVISFIFLGKKKTVGSIVGSILYPIFVSLTAPFVNMIDMTEISNDPLLIAIFGGVLAGVGAGLIFKTGFTTGGTDIINQIVSKYFKVSLGKALLFTDGLIVLAGGFVFGWVKLLYAIIILFIWSLITDRVVLGISQSKAFYIVTNKEKEITEYILDTLGHGVTALDAKGAFSGHRGKVLMTIIPTKEYFIFKEGIDEIDSEAFFIVTDSYEVSGGR